MSDPPCSLSLEILNLIIEIAEKTSRINALFPERVARLLTKGTS